MILIVARETDEHVPYVTRKLDAAGAEYFRFSPQDFPAHAEFSISYDRRGSVRRILKYRGKDLDLGQVRAVWNRARARPIADEKINSEQQWWVVESCSRFLAELWECLDCFWLPNRPIADRDAHRTLDPPNLSTRVLSQPPRLATPSGYNKLHQLAVAGRLGFGVPRTLVTNNPQRFLQFYEECAGVLISKNATWLRVTRDGEIRLAYTNQVQRRNAAGYQAIRYSPVVLQEEVPKKLELRVTVVDTRVFSAAIHSQESRLLRHDWRHHHDFGLSSYYSAHKLPAKIERLCVRLVRTLGLSFGAIDLILTPAGDYVFLEVNPNGQWAWIEDFTGLPISDAIAELLIRGAA